MTPWTLWPTPLWTGLPFPPPGALPDPEMEPVSPASAGDSSPLSTGEAHVPLQCSCLGNPMNRVRHDLESKQKQQTYEFLHLLFQIHVASRTPCQYPTFSWDLPQSIGNYLSEDREVRCCVYACPSPPLPQRHPLLKRYVPFNIPPYHLKKKKTDKTEEVKVIGEKLIRKTHRIKVKRGTRQRALSI